MIGVFCKKEINKIKGNEVLKYNTTDLIQIKTYLLKRNIAYDIVYLTVVSIL